MSLPTVRTEHLLLRPWREEDRESFIELNRNPDVMFFSQALLSPEQSNAIFDSLNADAGRFGYGLWAVEVRPCGDFVGFVGLSKVTFEALFTPAVEAGVRFFPEAWGRGYGTEAMRAALNFGFTEVGLVEIVAMATKANARSRSLLRRIGMRFYANEEFDHPLFPQDSPLRHFVLGRITVQEWLRFGPHEGKGDLPDYSKPS